MKDVIRYSESFKIQVIREIKEGVHKNCFSASQAYGIHGKTTVRNWLEKYGKKHLLRRVLKGESTEERNELQALRKRVRELASALSDANIDLRLERAFLEIACRTAGIEDVDAFKKKVDMRQFIKSMSKNAKLKYQ